MNNKLSQTTQDKTGTIVLTQDLNGHITEGLVKGMKE